YSCVLFFFSSRRRHTRFSRDWSSDVCSSDLATARVKAGLHLPSLLDAIGIDALTAYTDDKGNWLNQLYDTALNLQHFELEEQCEIGRASCRERVKISVADVSLEERVTR